MKLQVGGDFARALRSHNLVGWAEVLRNIFLNPAIFIWSIRTIFNRNKSGRCAPNNCNDARSYVSKLTTSRHHHNCRLRRRTYFFPVRFYFPMQKFLKMLPRISSVEMSPEMEERE